MATDKSTNRQTLNNLHAYAVELLKEIDYERGKAYAVAMAGRDHAQAAIEPDANLSCLFEVIGEIECDIAASTALRGKIDELAKLAGSTWTPEAEASHAGEEASHG